MTQPNQKPKGTETSDAVHTGRPPGAERGQEAGQQLGGQLGGRPACTGRETGYPAARGPSRPGQGEGSPLGSPGTLTVETLGRLPPQGWQAHFGIGPLQHQPPAVQVGAVAQGMEGSLRGGKSRKPKCELAETHLQTPHPAPLLPATASSSKARFWPL